MINYNCKLQFYFKLYILNVLEINVEINLTNIKNYERNNNNLNLTFLNGNIYYHLSTKRKIKLTISIKK